MREEPEAPNVIIAPEHQSAPAEHWMVKEMREAAREIDEGQFTPQLADDDYFYYGPDQLISQHPRVKEAIEKLRNEIDGSRNSQEALEKCQMLHEYNEQLSAPDRWDGQGRWIGKENEEMRQGDILSPVQFIQRLWAVIGRERVQINSWAVEGRVALLVRDRQSESKIFTPGRMDYNLAEAALCEEGSTHRNFKMKMKALEAKFARAEDKAYSVPDELKGMAQVATLQYPLGTEWMIMRFNEYGVPTSPRFLGWRTALLSMIVLNVITEKEAHQAFPVKPGPASLWYRAQLYALRN